MEVSPRAGGNRLAEMLKYATGTDLITKSIQAAIGEPIGEDFYEAYCGNWAEVILHADCAGRFEDLWIAKELQPHVIERDIWVQRGKIIQPFKAANEAIGTLVLQFDSQEELARVMDHIHKYVQVRVS